MQIVAREVAKDRIAVRADMDDPQIEDALSRVEQLAAAGLSEQAEALCHEILQKQPGEARVWRSLGRLGLTSNKLDAAEAAYRQASTVEPENPKNWSGLGTALVGKSRHAEAEGCFRRALAIQSNSGVTWSNLAAALMHQKKWDEAAEAFRQSLALNPNDGLVWAGLARVETERGKLREAKEAFEQAITIAPTPEDSVEYATLLVRLGERARAVYILRQVIEQAPDLSRAWQALGDLLSFAGHQADAEAAYRWAKEQDSTSAKSMFGSYAALKAQFKLAEAERMARELVQKDERDSRNV